MSLRVTADNYVREDAVEEYLAIVKELAEATNTLDKGVISYALYRDIDDPLHFTMFEEWENRDSLEAHLKSEHFARLIPGLIACCAKDNGPKLYEKAF